MVGTKDVAMSVIVGEGDLNSKQWIVWPWIWGVPVMNARVGKKFKTDAKD